MEIGQQWKSLGCGAFLGNEAQIPSVLACPDLVKSMNSNSNNHVGLLSFFELGVICFQRYGPQHGYYHRWLST